MNFAFKLIELMIPVIIEIIKNNHPDKGEDEHRDMAQKLITTHIQNLPKK